METEGLYLDEVLKGAREEQFRTGQKFNCSNGTVCELVGDAGQLRLVDSNKRISHIAYVNIDVTYDLIQEPQFKIGDWVVGKFINEEYIGKINWIHGEDSTLTLDSLYKAPSIDIFFTPNIVRYATPEEIAAEKQRRFWSNLGREVNEYKIGDIVTGSANDLMEVVEVNGDVLRCSQFHPYDQHFMYFNVSKEHVSLIASFEQRLDLK